jgi:tetratricopeptide (TPR) repeat protein
MAQGMAEWCLRHRRLTATAADFYGLALSAQPSLADDLEAGIQFSAACAAALAGCGVGADIAKVDTRRRAALRKQALGWLTAQYNVWAERHRQGKPADRTIAATAVRSWQSSQELAKVRNEKALARLPRDEQRDWQSLWAKVAALAARDPEFKFAQARAHVGRRQWKKAAKCYAEGFELGPRDDGELWFEYAAYQLLARDRPGYRRTCAYMLARCGPALPMRSYLVARACTLAAGSTDDPKRPGSLSGDELQAHGNEHWALTEKGALHVRAREIPEAIRLLKQSLAVDCRPGRAVLNWLWLALAYRELGKAEEARVWLAKATRWLDHQGNQMPVESPRMGSHRHNWLEAHVLRQQAEERLR